MTAGKTNVFTSAQKLSNLCPRSTGSTILVSDHIFDTYQSTLMYETFNGMFLLVVQWKLACGVFILTTVISKLNIMLALASALVQSTKTSVERSSHFQITSVRKGYNDFLLFRHIQDFSVVEKKEIYTIQGLVA